MRRAAAFSLVAILTLLGVLINRGTDNGTVVGAGVAALVAGVVFAAKPVSIMSLIGFVICAPIAVLQGVVFALPVLIVAALYMVVAILPLAAGVLGFLLIAQQWGTGAAVICLIPFVAALIAGREIYSRLLDVVRDSLRESFWLTLRALVTPVNTLRATTFAGIVRIGEWFDD